MRAQEEQSQDSKNLELLRAKISETKRDIKSLILKRREEQTTKLNTMKEAADKKKRELEANIEAVKMKMSNMMMKNKKKGEKKVCVLSNDEIGRKEYCEGNFEDVELGDCKKEKKFCEICCGKEFEEVDLKGTEECRLACESVKKNVKIKKFM